MNRTAATDASPSDWVPPIVKVFAANPFRAAWIVLQMQRAGLTTWFESVALAGELARTAMLRCKETLWAAPRPQTRPQTPPQTPPGGER